ncbi:hypothetical protein A6V39_03190 [Candidatus Mycoplasma haematobovis]|uniref:Uncharacterized protein n=1 Tax=Candidatus Mycoplasma haematobovis TaxID=432608 RepID=A0A1A9QE61_9MOLU|nr:hypothetical protein A6V39_03190 [Candidatus Mycoplasma haematobovis]
MEEKEAFLVIPEMVDFEFNIWIYERMYLWAIEVRYFFKKIKNKDKLIEEILNILDSIEGGLLSLEARKLRIKLNIFLKFKDLYYFS